MKCLKGKDKAKHRAGNYLCVKCGACAKKKSQVCKAKKIKQDK